MVRPPLDTAGYRTRLSEQNTPGEVQRWVEWAVEVPQLDICATRLRKELASGGDVSELLDPAVLDYIREHGLYARPGESRAVRSIHG